MKSSVQVGQVRRLLVEASKIRRNILHQGAEADIFTASIEVWGKVMFLHLCVIPLTGEEVGFPACITGHMTRVGSASGGSASRGSASSLTYKLFPISPPLLPSAMKFRAR